MAKAPKSDDHPAPDRGLATNVKPIDRLQMVRDYLGQSFKAALKWVDRKPVGDADLYMTYFQLRKLEEEVDAFHKAIDKALVTLTNEQLIPKFEDSESSSITTKFGFRIGMYYNTRCNLKGAPVEEGARPNPQAIKAQRDRIWDYCRKNGLGWLITETINASTLSSHAATLRKENKPDLPADLFNTFQQPVVSLTKVNNNG